MHFSKFFFWNVVSADILRVHCSDLHCNICQGSFHIIISFHVACNYSTDPATVDIWNNSFTGYLLKSSDSHILADSSDFICQGILNCSFAFIRKRHKCVHISCIVFESHLSQSLYESNELVVLCNEVCFWIYFYDSCRLAVSGDSCPYQSHRSNSSCLFSSLCKAFFF